MSFNEKIGPCTACSGKGRLEIPINDSETCGDCNGEGVQMSIPSSGAQAKCSTCHGHGSIVRLSTKTQICALCNGTGQIVQ